MSFSRIIGNKHIINLLKKGIRQKTLYPSLVFHGIEGIGKKLTALNIAKGFNCQSPSNGPCDSCSVCKSIDHHNFPDVRLILPEWYDERLDKKNRKSFNLKIDQIREIIHNISLKPYIASKKIYIIDYAEMLTEEASNSLLKTLEEPPPYAIIILITTAYYSLLPTIRSRCWGVPFNPIPSREIENFLINEREISTPLAKKLSIISEGSLKKALEAEPKDFSARSKTLLTMIEKALDGDIPFIIRGAEEISKNLEEFQKNLSVLSTLYRDIMMIQKTGDRSLLVNEDLNERLKLLTERVGGKALDIMEKVDEIKDLLRFNINKKVAAEALFFNLQ